MRYFTFGLLIFCVVSITGCKSSNKERARMKEEIKREIMAELGTREKLKQEILTELQAKQAAKIPEVKEALVKTPSPIVTKKMSEEERKKMKKEIEREILAKIEQQPQPTAHPISDRVGNAEGFILRKEKGIQGCNVKLVRMKKVFGMYSEDNEEEYQTVTDKDGKYRFNSLPVGSYKLKWELPGDKGWIRRVKKEPDIVIKKGSTSTLVPVDASKGALPF